MDKQLINEILTAAKDGHDDQVAWRRHLHQNPEIAFQEHDTTRYLRQTCRELGLSERKLNMKTGLVAEIKGKRKTPIIAIRTDIDALPVTEQTELEFASRRPGFMHACGHDMHMASILGTARILNRFADRLPGTIRFLFQPAEEHPPGGARPMIAAGALESVSAILGLHVDPHVPIGKIGLRDGVTMASVTDFDLIVHGRGGHAARPQDSVDAIVVASELVAALQTVVSRHSDPINSVAITFGRIEGGTARNVIADHVRLTGTARTLSAADSKRLPKLIKRVADGICRAHGAKAEMNLIASYPVLSNSAEVNAAFRRSFESLYGKGKIVLTDQVLGGEDFACYQEIIPGAMFRIGIRNPKIGADKPWHSPYFIADERAMESAAAVLATTAIDLLTSEAA
ncbi:amidohydrolase [candidate division GN15 bacterium]|nr:amidohydrolase [candidate division GN15 bacterium]